MTRGDSKPKSLIELEVKVGLKRGWFENGLPSYEVPISMGLFAAENAEWHRNGQLPRKAITNLAWSYHTSVGTRGGEFGTKNLSSTKTIRVISGSKNIVKHTKWIWQRAGARGRGTTGKITILRVPQLSGNPAASRQGCALVGDEVAVAPIRQRQCVDRRQSLAPTHRVKRPVLRRRARRTQATSRTGVNARKNHPNSFPAFRRAR